MLQFLGLAAGLLSLAAVIPYARDILRGSARPERASWFIWLVLAVISFTSQRAEGATNSLWLTALDTVGVAIVFGLSLKYGEGGLTRRDTFALMAAGIGLVLWYSTRHAAFALFITLAIDAVGTSLTVAKTYADPQSETYSMWAMVAVAGILAMLAVGKLDPVLLAYPFYIFLANAAVVVAIAAGTLRLKSVHKD